MSKKLKEIDLIIIGAGPAGLTAAIYATRANLKTLVLEKDIIGGQIRSSYTIENYPGFKVIKGNELADKMQEQAEALGAIIDEFDFIESVSFKDYEKIVETSEYLYKAKAIIIATGATPKKLPLINSERYEGKGIHYCAICDGASYKDEVIAVVGGGNAALEEALFLSKLAKKVIIIRRYDYFKAEATVLKQVEETENIEIMYNWDLVDVLGNDFVEKVKIKNTKTYEEKEVEIKAVFVYIGTVPKTTLFKEYINLNKDGYIKTDESMKTNIKGVFAAGDVREKEFRQITTAVADGTIASLKAEKYIVKEKGE
ncbi:thioredoxin-disulfide reductase [Clostridium tarantellae]|uniref:Thioredoxin reductase n=1 Tax=Clostridium tarantellae TaxID=39493 RepID=A0A6I1MHX9_9CLOT|nr:thioredoxin-disulfide reductase [Clostridium tarantellae]MPQ42353.1 thioredoxin-disulfide reductase [Clostridium tarantellae]